MNIVRALETQLLFYDFWSWKGYHPLLCLTILNTLKNQWITYRCSLESFHFQVFLYKKYKQNKQGLLN